MSQRRSQRIASRSDQQVNYTPTTEDLQPSVTAEAHRDNVASLGQQVQSHRQRLIRQQGWQQEQMQTVSAEGNGITLDYLTRERRQREYQEWRERSDRQAREQQEERQRAQAWRQMEEAQRSQQIQQEGQKRGRQGTPALGEYHRHSRRSRERIVESYQWMRGGEEYRRARRSEPDGH